MKKIFLLICMLISFTLLSCNEKVRIYSFGEEAIYKNGDSIIVNHYDELNQFEIIINSDDEMYFHFELGISSNDFNGPIDTLKNNFTYIDSTGNIVEFIGNYYTFTGNRTITINYDEEIALVLDNAYSYYVNCLGKNYCKLDI